jgi:hypothetical protein
MHRHPALFKPMVLERIFGLVDGKGTLASRAHLFFSYFENPFVVATLVAFGIE